jgi:TonB-dependent starch-binding outer membrane protein SusC
LQDGSFFRCTNITLGYTLPGSLLNKVKMSGLRVYVNANNPFTITNYRGYNPEVDYSNGNNLAPGVDYGKYPLARGYMVGVRVSF